MRSCAELLGRARSNPRGLRFTELCALAECYGWEFDRSRGSHHIYKRAGYIRVMNFQDIGGAAKPYQVRQLLHAIDALQLDRGER